VLGFFYSQDKNIFELDKKLSLIVFPMILSSGKFSLNKYHNRLVAASFVIGCTLAGTYSLIIASLKSEPMRNLTEMTTEALGISHVYFGLYLAFCIIILIIEIINKHLSRRLYLLEAILASYLLFLLVLIGGKMSLMAILILICLTVLFLVKEKGLLRFGLTIVIIFSLLFFVAVICFPNVGSRLGYLFDKSNYFVGDNAWNSIGSRLSIFDCAKSLAWKSFFFGTGVGDVQTDLNDCYNDKGFRSLMNMNAHNQFIQILLAFGILGLSYYLFFIFHFIIKSFKARNYLLTCFFSLFFLCCFTESLLERQHGVMFFSFFSCLFYFSPFENNPKIVV